MLSIKEIFEPECKEEIFPVGVGAGVIKCRNLGEAERLITEVSLSPVYMVVLGSATVDARSGNADPTYIYDDDKDAAYNAEGLPGPGIHEVLEMLPSLREILDQNRREDEHRKILGLSISPATMGGEGMSSIEQIKYMMGLLKENEYLDFVEINTSCPNDVDPDGLHKPIGGYDLEFIYELVDYLNRSFDESDKVIGLKLPPYIIDEHMDQLVQLAPFILHSPAVGYIATANTIPGDVHGDEDENQKLSVGSGGKSGPATNEIGYEQLELWLDLMEETGTKKYIISMLGVSNGEDVFDRIDGGADLVAVVTALLGEKGIGKGSSKIMEEYVQKILN